jgi:hypothetical protein
MTSSGTSSETPPLVAGAGLTRLPTPVDDPYRALDDLMLVVEALCRVWPQRPTFSSMPKMRL